MNSKVDGLLKKVVDEFDVVKFEVYRIALKLGKIQDIICFDLINTKKLRLVLENRKLQPAVNINLSQLKEIITDAIEKSDNLGNIKLNEISELAATFTYRIFKSTKNMVKISDFLFFLNILSYHGLKSKFKAIFEIYANMDVQTIDWSSFQQFKNSKKRLLQAINEKPSILEEDSRQGFFFTLDEFVKQSELEFVGVMHRLKYASRTWHDVACSVCKVRPMVGMRFQCLKCFNYNTCQVCFLLQKATHNHKITHPQHEYCVRAGNKDKLSSAARTIRNNITKKYKKEQSSKCSSEQSASETTSFYDEDEQTIPDNFNSFPSKQINELVLEENVKLKKLVERLDHENEVMAGTVKFLENASKSKENDDTYNMLVLHSKLDHLTEHNRSLQEELNNLKSAVFTDFLRPNQHFQDLNGTVSSSLTDISYVTYENCDQLSDSLNSKSDVFKNLKLNNKSKIKKKILKSSKHEISNESCSSDDYHSASLASCSSANNSFQSELNRDEEEIESKLDSLLTTFDKIDEKEEEFEHELSDCFEKFGRNFETFLDVALQLAQSSH